MKLDMNNKYHQLIVGACANLITEEGYTAREVLELLESAKSDLWSALKQIEIEIGGTNIEFRAWDKNKIFEKSVDTKSKKNNYVFYDGPATANGMPGIHHMMAKQFYFSYLFLHHPIEYTLYYIYL